MGRLNLQVALTVLVTGLVYSFLDYLGVLKVGPYVIASTIVYALTMIEAMHYSRIIKLTLLALTAASLFFLIGEIFRVTGY